MFHKILVPLDGSPLAEQAIALAATVAARAGGASGSIELVLVDTKAYRAPDSAPAGDATDRIYISGMAEEVSRLLGVACTGIVVDGNPGDAIVQRAEATNADLIVMTTHGRTGLSRALLGSVADQVVREAGRPVMLQRAMTGRRWRTSVSGGFHRILVPLDGTDESASVLSPALDMCRWMEARPILARVILPIVEMRFSDAGVPASGVFDKEATRQLVNRTQNALTELALDIEADRRIRVEWTVNVGNDVGKTLVEIARERSVDLIAMVTQSHGSSRLLIGSVADRMLREGNVPLLLLHAQPAALTAAKAEMHAFA